MKPRTFRWLMANSPRTAKVGESPIDPKILDTSSGPMSWDEAGGLVTDSAAELKHTDGEHTVSAIHETHDMIAPASFLADAGAGQETCSRCHTCTCHDQGATLAEPCLRAGGVR